MAKAPAKKADTPKRPDNNKRLAELEAAEAARQEATKAGENDPASESIVKNR